MNIKKLFPGKNISKKGFMDFLDRKGFFIVLVLCIAIVAATAVFVTTHNLNTTNTKSDADKIIPEEANSNTVASGAEKPALQSSISTTSANTEGKAIGKATASDKPASLNSQNKQSDQSKSTTNTQVSNNSAGTASTKPNIADKVQQFIMPVSGEVTTAFAQANLVYSKTLEEWRAHSGTDISAERGTPVKTVAEGVVVDVKNDPRLGITVIIEHANGIKTLYANLASDDMVSVNQKVKQNDVIGCVGNTANFEVADQ